MTHEEVYQELGRDREGISKWWRHQLMDLKRPMLKSTTFPRKFWYDYTSTRRIRYLFQTRIFDKRMRKILTGVIVPRRMSDGVTVYTDWLGDQKLISPIVVLPHTFKRYAERCKVDKTGLDLIKHFFTINNYFADCHNQDIVGRKVRYNGEEHVACCVNEGILLGQQQGDLLIIRTFITYDMCSGLQQKVLEEKRTEIKTDVEVYNNAKHFYKGL